MMPTMEQTAADPVWRSDVPCVVWPAVGSDASAHLQSLLFQLEHSQWLTEAEYLPSAVSIETAGAPCAGNGALLRGADVRTGRRIARLDSFPLPAGTEPQGASGQLRASEEHSRSAQSWSHRCRTEFRLDRHAGALPADGCHTAVLERPDPSRAFLARTEFLRKAGRHPHQGGGGQARQADWGPPVSLLFLTGPGAALNVRTDVEEQLEWLQRENPDYLITHASNLAVLAELTLRRGVRLPNLRQVRSYSEALRPDLRELVRAAWGVEVADIYSCEEAGQIALSVPGTSITMSSRRISWWRCSTKTAVRAGRGKQAGSS